MLPDNLSSTETPLSQIETKILHLASSSLKSLPLRHGAVYQSWDEGQEEITPKLTQPKPQKILPTMAAADGSLGRSLEDQQDTAAALGAGGHSGPQLDILRLHWIITYISLPTSI